MAPVVREIAKRSLAPTELVLKRQTGDGRREEIFVSRRDLQVKLRGLLPATRAVFAPLELGEPPAEDEPTAKMAPEKPPVLLVEKKRPTVADKSLFAEGLARDKAPIPAPEVKSDTVRLDDSIERLIVAEETQSPDITRKP
jgi:hypothetical protein